MKKLLVANWKMNPSSFKEAQNIFKNVLKQNFYNKKLQIILCPPFIWLKSLIDQNKNKIDFGAQNVFWENNGAFTGEISSLMLKKTGVKYVILGHSERRKNLAETDEMINKKIKAVLDNNLIPILCVGENYEIRKKGIKSAQNFVLSQLKKNLNNLKQKESKLIVAYEPVWAISTNNIGIPDTPQNASLMINFIKNYLQKTGFKNNFVLYGGSVNSKNILKFLKQENIDGVLVGSASVNVEEFKKIIQILNKGL